MLEPKPGAQQYPYPSYSQHHNFHAQKAAAFTENSCSPVWHWLGTKQQAETAGNWMVEL